MQETVQKGPNILLQIIQSILPLCQTQPFSYRGSLKAGPRPFIRTRWNGQPMSETSWDRHRGKFLNKRLREILREREREINAQRAAYWWQYCGVFEMSSGSALKCDIDGGPSPQWWFQLRWNQTCALLTLWVRMDEKRRNLGLGRIRPKLN